MVQIPNLALETRVPASSQAETCPRMAISRRISAGNTERSISRQLGSRTWTADKFPAEDAQRRRYPGSFM